jgi:site-specific DNA-methyltransferase (adenine-specific)
MPAPQISSPFLDLRRMDCMELMAQYPDKHFELAIVDPPYGIEMDGDHMEEYNKKSCDSWKGRKPKGYNRKAWDSKRPNSDYFKELLRVSVNQVVWGGNYFSDFLYPTGGWVVWDKQVVMPTFSDGELAWSSVTNSVKFIRLLWAGYRKCEETSRIHPTQKPVALYNWLLENYAKPGDKILDTHMGSGSIAIACHYRQHHLTACELDEDYFRDACKRIEKETRQLTFI